MSLEDTQYIHTNMTQSVTPVLLLTGYLGSGKTTLLNRILQNKQGIKFAVIVNDIGEVNIDANLIAKGGIVGEGDDSLVPLQNGCICCTLKMDLVQQLSDIVSEQRFDYIVIEASGICEPAPIAQTISVYPQMYPNLATKGIARLDSVVTVVDALRLRDEFSEGHDLYMKEDDLASLVIQQIEFCNTILLNKSSEVSAEELGRIKAIIREIQPKAEIITCDYCDVDLDKLVNSNSFDFEQVATSAKWIAAVEGDEEEKEEHEHHHHHAHDHEEEENDEHEHHHHDHDHCHCHHHHGLENEEEGEALEYGISTFVYKRREPFDMTEFDQLVARLWPSSVIRCKGLCYFATEPDMCYVFEQAGKQVSLSQAGQWYATMPADELEQFKQQNPAAFKDWDDKYGDRMQKLVFIGQHMDREAIETLLDACIKK